MKIYLKGSKELLEKLFLLCIISFREIIDVDSEYIRLCPIVTCGESGVLALGFADLLGQLFHVECLM